MQVAQLVLTVVQLLALLVLLCCLRVLWARLPEPHATAEQWQEQQEAFRANPPKLTPEEQAQVAAYRARWKGVVTDDQPDLEVLALSRLNHA